MKRLLAVLIAASVTACSSACSEPARAVVAQPIRDVAPPAPPAKPEPKCVAIYRGSIEIDSFRYVHYVEHEGEYALAPVENIDQPIPNVTKLHFTLDYPFEKPFTGEVSGTITLRKIVDAIRAGFRTMYAGAVEKPIPGMMNRDVKGKYGAAIHSISDLVIERVELCEGDELAISIGS